MSRKFMLKVIAAIGLILCPFAGAIAQIGPIPGYGVSRFVAPIPLTIAWTAQDSQNTAASAYTYSSESIGTAALNRRILVGFTSEGGTVPSITSMTIGGISASRVIAGGNTSGSDEFWIAAVPTGSTATIVVNLSGSNSRSGIGIWAIYGGSSVTATATSAANPSVASLNVPLGGVAVAFAGGAATATYTGSPTALTKNFDNAIGGTAATMSGGSLALPGGVSSLSMTITRSSSTGGVDGAVFATFGP